MIDTVHFVVLVGSIGMIGVGLWLIAPSAMFVGIGIIGLIGIVSARTGYRKKKTG